MTRQRADEVGSLTPGKRTDIALLGTDDVNTTPVHDPVETIVFQAGVANIETVLVDGTVVKRDGDLRNEPASTRQQQLVQSGRRVLEQSGLDET